MHLNIPYWKRILKDFTKKSLLILAYFVISLAVLSSIFRALTPMAVRYQPELEQLLQHATGQPVKIESIHTGWYWFQPLIKAERVTIGSDNKNAINIQEIQLGISLLGSLIHWRIQPGLLLINGLTLNIEETDSGWKIQDFLLPVSTAGHNNKNLEDFFIFILGHQTLQIKKVRLGVKLKSHPLIQVEELNATLVNSLGKQRIRGQMIIKDMSVDPIDFGAELILSPLHPEKIIGHLYLGVEKFNLIPWLKKMALSQIQVEDGLLQAKIWGDISEGKLKTLQTIFTLSNLSWKEKAVSKLTHLDSTRSLGGQLKEIRGELAWMNSSEKWRLIGKHISIEESQHIWPLTDFSLDMNERNENFDLAVTIIDLKRLFHLRLPLSAAYQWLNQAHFSGQLSDLRLVREGGIYKVSTQFKNLSLKAIHQFPSIAHANGVLNWEATHGRLVLQSPNLEVQMKARPKLIFSLATMDVSWQKAMSDSSWSVVLDNLALDSSHLKLNGQGKLDNYAINNAGLADFTFDFALQAGEYWRSFLPKKSLKPKLYTWLTKDVHEIKKALGSVQIKGELKDFPFDKREGTFHIETDLEGVSLNFAEDWPSANDINAHLDVNKRDLSTHISHATIGGIQTGPINIVVNQLGLDKERLMVHGLAKGESSQAWPMILASPLAKKNAFLSSLHWQGPLSLDLQLDVPLFAEDNDILILGKVALSNVDLLLHTSFMQLEFNQIDGILNFDGHGLLSSQLTTQLWRQSVPVEIRRTLQPEPKVSMKLKTKAKVDDIFNLFQQQPIEGLTGEMTLEANLIKSRGKDTLVIGSDLKNLEIDFPLFIQKKKKDSAPFEATINFASKGQFIADLHYADKLFVHHAEQGLWSIKADLPSIQGEIGYDNNLNFISGEIHSLIIPDNLDANFSSNSWKGKPSQLPQLDIKISKFQYGQVVLGSVLLKAKTDKHIWRIDPWVIESPSYLLRGNAECQTIKDEQHSQLNVDFETKDMHQALLQWEMHPVLEKGRGRAYAQLNWPDAIWRGTLAKMSGELTMKITQGRTMNFNKQTESKLGLVKLLNILSLQTIPRRLKLDFSDLSQDGYSFDEFEGKFHLQEGILRAESCSIDGPVAAAEITGSVDVIQKLYNLSIRISPHIAASLPLVAVIAGGPIAGPIAGIATLAATKIINRGFQKIVAYSYKVTGPWADPVIEPLKLYRANR